MRKHSIVIHATMIIALVLALSAVVMAADPFVGTWKLNISKSKYNPGPPPKSSTVNAEAQDNGVRIVVNGVNSEGKPVHQETTLKYDGKDYPLIVTAGPSDITVSVKKVDANTHDLVVKRAGKETQTGREVVSKDGKTMTRTGKGKNLQGQDFNNTLVYDKQ